MVDPLESSPSGASSTVEDTGDTVKSPPSVGAGLVAIFSWFPGGRKRGCSRIIISLSSMRRTNLQLCTSVAHQGNLCDSKERTYNNKQLSGSPHKLSQYSL